MAHKTWLQTSTPMEATGKNGCLMPDCDVIHKYFRIRGKTTCLASVYFDCGIGLAGDNVKKMEKIDELRSKGHMDVIVSGDFNMTVEDWDEEVLNKMDMQILTANTKYTCKNAYNSEGGSHIDYILASRSIAPLIRNISTVGGEDGIKVPWSPHVGLSFEVHGAAGALWTRQQQKP